MPSIATEKAPIVMFDYKEYGTDAEASLKAGRPIPRTVPFALIQPDKYTRMEYPAEEWLARKRTDAINGKCNPDWVTRWEMQYAAWQKGEELPPDGQPVKTWESLNKEQRNRLIALGFLTIEQVSLVPDTNLADIGLDGRYLRDLARTALEQHKNGGAQSIKIAALEQSNRDKDATITNLMARVTALEQSSGIPPAAILVETPKRGPGRPKGS